MKSVAFLFSGIVFLGLLSMEVHRRRLLVRPVSEAWIVFGYKDSRPARFVSDRYERMLLVESLVAPCLAGEARSATYCGFQRKPSDPDSFSKVIETEDGRGREIRLRVVHSSVGADDEENRKDPFQVWRSDYAENEFKRGLTRGEVVLYNGHSRDGGGPDFRPPVLRDENVDFAWYRRATPGKRAMLETLEEADRESRGPQYIGIFSCLSEKHFREDLRRNRPALAMRLTHELIYFADALASTRTALSEAFR